eukprot:TRINITY_DN24813_c0_g1_i1.p1 TRINITY_DN24813_c0_g1~~TRINITY_DN24813_c0_g1_i1.p1  ORF type:complete len:978 (+),score=131.42 TRINITY_DN24813_c0_g1_i1:58-2934(+)
MPCLGFACPGSELPSSGPSPHSWHNDLDPNLSFHSAISHTMEEVFPLARPVRSSARTASASCASTAAATAIGTQRWAPASSPRKVAQRKQQERQLLILEDVIADVMRSAKTLERLSLGHHGDLATTQLREAVTCLQQEVEAASPLNSSPAVPQPVGGSTTTGDNKDCDARGGGSTRVATGGVGNSGAARGSAGASEAAGHGHGLPVLLGKFLRGCHPNSASSRKRPGANISKPELSATTPTAEPLVAHSTDSAAKSDTATAVVMPSAAEATSSTAQPPSREARDALDISWAQAQLPNDVAVGVDGSLPTALNDIISIIWPRLSDYVETIARDMIEPAIDEALPEVFSGSVKFTKITLGTTSPRLGPVRAHHVAQPGERGPIEVHVGVDVASELDVRLTAVGVSLGISRVSVKGDLVLLLGPAMTKPPFFGGVQVYFPNAPSIDMEFSGVAKLASIPGLRGVIRTAIDDAVAGVCVLPRRVAVDLDEEDAVDVAELTYPEPLGILRLTLYGGSDLVAADLNLFGAATSDPYVVARLGIKTWTSPSVNKTLNPVWGADGKGLTVDFPVHDDCQKLLVRVFDKDFATQDDLIGVNEGLDVRDLLATCADASGARTTIPLRTASGQSGAGCLHVSARYLRLTTSPPSPPSSLSLKQAKGASSPARSLSSSGLRGPSVAHVSLKVLTVTGLEALGAAAARYPFRVRMRVLAAPAADGHGGGASVADEAACIPPFLRSSSRTQRQLDRADTVASQPSAASSASSSATAAAQVLAEALSGESFAKSVQGLAEAVMPICAALRARGHSNQDIADILEVDLIQVDQFLRHCSLQDARTSRQERNVLLEAQARELAKRSVRNPRFDEVVQLLVPPWQGPCQIELAILDRQRKCLGRALVPLDALLGTPSLRFDGPLAAIPEEPLARTAAPPASLCLVSAAPNTAGVADGNYAPMGLEIVVALQMNWLA